MAGAQPNFFESGHSAPSPSHSTRQKTRAPGAARQPSRPRPRNHRIERNPTSEGALDITLLLDRVTEGNAVSRRAGSERHLDFADRGAIEGRAKLRQQFEDFRRGIGLDRVEDSGLRHRGGDGQIVSAARCRDRPRRRGHPPAAGKEGAHLGRDDGARRKARAALRQL